MDSNNPGPIDPSVLYEQERHVSSAVWDGQERGALRCHEHTSKLSEWRLTPKQANLVERAGFGHLRRIPAISLDNPLISALVERWRRETNTFHFTVGEMTVTLQDVALLLGLSIDGHAVIGVTHTTCSSVCSRLLGKSPDSNYASGGMVKLSWLKEFFSQLSQDASDEEVEQCTRAYLLYLVGSTIFSTTTGNKVPVMYLPLFEDFDESGKYAWGAAALAFLYRALGNACVKTQSTICGCLTLLQCWSYFHLNIGRPKLSPEVSRDQFPFVLRWKGKQNGPTANRDVVYYRKALDLLKPMDVEWLPYKYMDSTAIPDGIRKNLIHGRAKTMLICFDKAERHLPDRCLRQYGLCQPIPEDVDKWLRKSRGVDGGVDLSGKMEAELNEWLNRHLNIVSGDDDGDDGEYVDWFLRITRKVVGRPISLSSEFQRTISGLKEIAYLADSFSTKGLDAQQFETISRIRYISQDCLRDQTPATPPPLPSLELVKRIRGKEKVRKKGIGKRKRKDDPMDYQETSYDDPLPPFGVIISVDPSESRQIDDEDEQLHMDHASFDIDHQQLYNPEGDSMLVGTEGQDVVDAEPLDMVDKIVHHIPSEMSSKIGDYHTQAVLTMVYNSQHSGMVDDTKQEWESGSIHVSEFQNFESDRKLDDSYLASTVEALDTKHPSTTNRNVDEQLLDACKEDDLHLPNVMDEEGSSKVSLFGNEIQDIPLSVTIEEINKSASPGSELQINDLDVHDKANVINNAQQSNGTEDARDFLIPGDILDHPQVVHPIKDESELSHSHNEIDLADSSSLHEKFFALSGVSSGPNHAADLLAMSNNKDD